MESITSQERVMAGDDITPASVSLSETDDKVKQFAPASEEISAGGAVRKPDSKSIVAREIVTFTEQEKLGDTFILFKSLVDIYDNYKDHGYSEIESPEEACEALPELIKKLQETEADMSDLWIPWYSYTGYMPEQVLPLLSNTTSIRCQNKKYLKNRPFPENEAKYGDFMWLSKLPKLESLFLQNDRITELPFGVCFLRNLKKLDLKITNLSALPKRLVLPGVTELFLTVSTFDSPSDILKCFPNLKRVLINVNDPASFDGSCFEETGIEFHLGSNEKCAIM